MLLALFCAMVLVDQTTKGLAVRCCPAVVGRAARPWLGWRVNRDCTLARLGARRALALWLAAGATLLVLGTALPTWGVAAGAVAWGAALSNVLDVLRRGGVVDLAILWPRSRANLADVALVLGGVGLLAGVAA